MRDLENNALYEDIKQIQQGDSPKVFFTYEVYFRVRKPNPIEIPESQKGQYGSHEEKDDIYRPLKLKSIDTIRDYVNTSADDITLTAIFGLGLWTKILQPYRDYLECVIRKIPLKDSTRDTDQNTESTTSIYYAIPKSVDQNATANQLGRYSRDELDTLGLVEVQWQLIDLSIEKLRAVSIGGIYRKVKNEEVLKALITKSVENIKVDEEHKAIETLSIYKADNQTQREHTVIADNTPLLSLPFYLQKKAGGIYSFGLSSYIQERNWYIFPTYNTKRFDEENKTLTVIKVPNTHYDEIEKTYRKQGDKLYILAASTSAFLDRGQEALKESGSGIRYSSASRYMNELVETKDNKAIAHRKKLNNEYLIQDLKVRDESRNKVALSANPITDNTYHENSQLSMRVGSIYLFTWRRCDCRLLYPGMPVKVLYLKQGSIHELYGTLLKVHVSEALSGQGITSQDYDAQAALAIFANMKQEKK